ncbi:hypothetical protein ACS0TY_034194 [Phlomoides rotata]
MCYTTCILVSHQQKNCGIHLKRNTRRKTSEPRNFLWVSFLIIKWLILNLKLHKCRKQVIHHDIHAEGIVVCETFQVTTIIKKLSPVWKDFKNYLKHKRKPMNVELLVARLNIEEGNKTSEKKHSDHEAKVNVVEQG